MRREEGFTIDDFGFLNEENGFGQSLENLDLKFSAFG
jgi:hypothetical protein